MLDNLGPLGLFLSAFLAATLLPFSSEAALVVALESGMTKTVAMLAASTGNILALMVNFGLGYWLSDWSKKRIENSRTASKAYAWSHRYGYAALLLSPLPIIGDPITLAAGVVRLNFIWFILLAGSLRVLRYWLITLAY